MPLLDVHVEGKLQREIKDILDELDMMIHVYKQQREVMRRFCKHVEHILDPEGRWKEGMIRDKPDDRAPPAPTTASAAAREREWEQEEQDERREQLYWFRIQARELLSDVDGRMDELAGLRKAAESSAQNVRSGGATK